MVIRPKLVWLKFLRREVGKKASVGINKLREQAKAFSNGIVNRAGIAGDSIV